jgi:hypothetical protein
MGIVGILAQDDHFTPSPHRGMPVSFGGCVTGASRCPTIITGVVSPTHVEIVALASTSSAAPDDHFGPRPNSAMEDSANWSVGCARGCPSIASWIVSSARIQCGSVDSAPNDH